MYFHFYKIYMKVTIYPLLEHVMETWKQFEIKISQKYFKLFKSNQINFIVTLPQHMCLGEWNSWECAETIYL